MHETSLAQSIFDVLEQNFRNGVPGRPEQIRVSVGMLAQVNAGALSEAFSILSEDSRWSSAALKVTEEEARLVCALCEAETDFPAAACPECGSPSLNLRQGDHLRIEEVTFDVQS